MISVVIISVGIVSILLHELGHAGMAYALRVPVKAWGMKWTGPFVHISINPTCKWKAVLCLFSGPFVNLLLILFLLYPAYRLVGWVNVYLFVTCLILPKSDGWKIWAL